MTREDFRDKKSKDYRKYREARGIKDPVYLDEIEDAYYQGMVDADAHRAKPISISDFDKALVESKIVEDLLIERACDWLEKNIDSYLSSVIASLGYSDYVLDWNFINDFKKAMKER